MKSSTAGRRDETAGHVACGASYRARQIGGAAHSSRTLGATDAEICGSLRPSLQSWRPVKKRSAAPCLHRLGRRSSPVATPSCVGPTSNLPVCATTTDRATTAPFAHRTRENPEGRTPSGSCDIATPVR